QRSDHSHKAQMLVDEADQALLCAKQTGRNRVVCFSAIRNPSRADYGSVGQGSVFSGVTARDVMSPVVFCLHEEDTISQAAELLLRLRTNAVCVVDADGKVAGMLSEKDILAAMVSPGCRQQPVRDVMKTHVITYDEDAPVESIHQFLCRVSIRRVVIVSDGRPIGTVSRGTLVRWFHNLAVAFEPSAGTLNPASTPAPAEEES
ncbi:MAG: CBS domain-containing protein, partial [Pirellulales bacterium]|nr:CBS domain-containing protein [Pirellulales bacterium]